MHIVATDREKAERVRASIPEKIGLEALTLVEDVFLSCMSDRELALLRFLRLGYRAGPVVLSMHGHPRVAPVLGAQRALLGEAHLYKGFTRFADYGGTLVGIIQPKNCVLPYLARHFALRYPNEDFLLYDKTYHLALSHRGHALDLQPVDSLQLAPIDEREARYQALWKQFYRTIAIEGRENPRCRMTHLPKRYWAEMVEMRELL